ncbi:MAG: quinone-dependent dihydroorotate dehydrogenase [Bacteroidetes bacterium]|nr:quinone-dependent dihydroorotate dehydrogenase [Bacteroidota bacterium]
MYSLLRKLLFTIQPERVHHLIMYKLNILYKIGFTRSILKKLFSVTDSTLEKEVFGIKFPNPVGLAAGFDKDAKYTDALACLGFGFLEIGTVTPRPQPGNPKPRLFRLPQDQALINRMGFNNDGATASAIRLKKRRETLIIGGNIGKNKDTPNEQAIQDYEAAFRTLYEVVDYFVVNVSSPNTPGLRALQDKEPLMALLNQLQTINQSLGNPKPILLKIAPDLSNEQLEDIVQIVATTAIAGVVATNTTINRDSLNTPNQEVELIGAGGLSGAPVRERSTEVIRILHTRSKGAFPIIAVGGIFTAKDALEKLNAGASLVQVYTGFIYEGPSIVKNICKGLASSAQ